MPTWGERGVTRIEEHEITGAERVAPDGSPPAGDLGGAAAKFEHGLVEDVKPFRCNQDRPPGFAAKTIPAYRSAPERKELISRPAGRIR